MPLFHLTIGPSDEDMQQEYQRGVQEGRADMLNDLRRELARLKIVVPEGFAHSVPSAANATHAIENALHAHQDAIRNEQREVEILTYQLNDLRRELQQSGIPELQKQISWQRAALETAKQDLAAQRAMAEKDQSELKARNMWLSERNAELEQERARQDEVLYRQTVQLQRQQQQPQQQKR